MGKVIPFNAMERGVPGAARPDTCCMIPSIDGLGRIVAQLGLLVEQLDGMIARLPEGEGRDRLVGQRAGLVIKLYLAQRAVIDAERFARDWFPFPCSTSED